MEKIIPWPKIGKKEIKILRIGSQNTKIPLMTSTKLFFEEIIFTKNCKNIFKGMYYVYNAL